MIRPGLVNKLWGCWRAARAIPYGATQPASARGIDVLQRPIRPICRLGHGAVPTQEEIKAANRSPYYVPSGDESDQAFAESFRRVREAHDILSDPESKARYDGIASQFTDVPKFSSGWEDGAEWSYGEEIAGDFVGALIVEIRLAPFSNG